MNLPVHKTTYWLTPMMPQSSADRQEYIEKVVARHTGIEVAAMRKVTRVREIKEARQICQYFQKKYTAFSLKVIGSLYGGQDHSTVINSCYTVQDLYDTDRDFKRQIDAIDADLKWLGAVKRKQYLNQLT